MKLKNGILSDLVLKEMEWEKLSGYTARLSEGSYIHLSTESLGEDWNNLPDKREQRWLGALVNKVSVLWFQYVRRLFFTSRATIFCSPLQKKKISCLHLVSFID
jgi:hypothetical protein